MDERAFMQPIVVLHDRGSRRLATVTGGRTPLSPRIVAQPQPGGMEPLSAFKRPDIAWTGRG